MKRFSVAFLAVLVATSILAAQCAAPLPTVEKVVETVVVEKEVVVTATPEPLAEEGPLLIGASLPLTGGFAINGQKHKDGYELCAKLINERGGLLGRDVEIIVSDNQSDVETSLAQVERFLSVDNVDLIFGSFSSRLTFPLSSVTEQAKMVHPIPSGAALRIYERGYDYLFYFQPQAAEFVGLSPIGLIEDLVDEADQPKTAALVHADDFFADAIAAGLMGIDVEIEGTDIVVDMSPGILAEAGIELVYEEKWPEEGFSDWIGLANSMKANEAELVIGLTASPDEAIQLVRAMQTVDYQPKALYLSQGTQAEFQEALGDAANGVMIHSAWDPAVEWEGLLAGEPFTNQDFIAAFEAEFGRAGDEDEAIPFALCQGMEQAVRATGGTDNTAIRDWLASRTANAPVKTILGDFYWDKRGLPIGKPYLMTQWQDGELKFVYPVGDFPGTSDLVWPKPEW